MLIDLHTHSTASDGTLRPAELVLAAARAGLDVVAVTDHDTTAGWPEALAACPDQLTVIRGAEFSCHWNAVEPPLPVHLLGYLFDPDHPDLVAELTRIRAGRSVRARRMIERLNADGIDITWAEVRSDARGGSVGRPHIARALVRRGLVPTVSDAFHPDWLSGRYQIERPYLDVFRTVALIQRAGGATVIGHPLAARGDRTVPDELFGQLAARGLVGIEVDHPDHTGPQRGQLLQLAQDLDLVVTGGSDFHGTNKTVGLGASTTGPVMYERLIAGRFLGPGQRPGS